MYDWFECKVRYDKTLENGLVKKVTEPYLVDAFNFTEAEKRIIEEMKPFIKGEFEVADIKRVKIADLFESEIESDDRWYKLKLTYTTIDEKKGTEKKTSNYVIVKAASVKKALMNLEEGMKGSIMDYVISSVSETPIIDVYHYIQSSDKA